MRGCLGSGPVAELCEPCFVSLCLFIAGEELFQSFREPAAKLHFLPRPCSRREASQPNGGRACQAARAPAWVTHTHTLIDFYAHRSVGCRNLFLFWRSSNFSKLSFYILKFRGFWLFLMLLSEVRPVKFPSPPEQHRISCSKRPGTDRAVLSTWWGLAMGRMGNLMRRSQFWRSAEQIEMDAASWKGKKQIGIKSRLNCRWHHRFVEHLVVMALAFWLVASGSY